VVLKDVQMDSLVSQFLALRLLEQELKKMRVDFHCEVLLVIVEAVLLRYTEDLPQVLVNDELDADSLVLVVHQVLL